MYFVWSGRSQLERLYWVEENPLLRLMCKFAFMDAEVIRMRGASRHLEFGHKLASSHGCFDHHHRGQHAECSARSTRPLAGNLRNFSAAVLLVHKEFFWVKRVLVYSPKPRHI